MTVISISPRELAHFAIQMGAMQKAPELESLIALVDKMEWVTSYPNGPIILEIGAGNGGTSWAWSKLGAAKLIVIDLPNGPWGGTDTQPMFKYISENTSTNIDLIYENSQSSEALEAFKERLGDNKVDFLFIDAGHDYNSVKMDFINYTPFVRRGGYVALHDICPHPPETGCEVDKFWNELKETLPKERYWEFISEPTTWGGIAVIKWE